MAMEIDLQRIQPEAFGSARESLARAFIEYPLIAYALPVRARRLAACRAMYGSILADALRLGECMATTDFAAVACWIPSEAGPMTLFRQLRSGMLAMPLRFGLTGISRLIAYDLLQTKLHHEYASDAHWFLAVIGVVPDRQGEGLGGCLLRARLERADREGRACYLETHAPQNVRFYEQHGFRVVWTGTPKGHAIPIWAMRRERLGQARE